MHTPIFLNIKLSNLATLDEPQEIPLIPCPFKVLAHPLVNGL